MKTTIHITVGGETGLAVSLVAGQIVKHLEACGFGVVYDKDYSCLNLDEISSGMRERMMANFCIKIQEVK